MLSKVPLNKVKMKLSFQFKLNLVILSYVLKDIQGAKNMSSTEVAGQYAYELPITRNMSIRAGLQASYVSRYLNYADLTFPHQYDDKGLNDPNNGYAFSNPRKGFVDISS